MYDILRVDIHNIYINSYNKHLYQFRYDIDMRIAIIGAGVAGSFLASILNREHNVEVFESSKREEHFPVCAWGTSRYMLEYYSKLADLNFDDYILHIGKKIEMRLPTGEKEFLDCNGLVTYDKERWEKDLLSKVRVNYGIRVSSDTFPLHRYDYVLDCTGFHRTMLPHVDDFIVPAYEYLLENVKHDEFYIIGYKNATGYFWYFPLNNNRAFVGAGDVKKVYHGMEEFFNENKDVKIIRKIGRPIRITPPTKMEPFSDRNIIGVGESIGCVFPLLGEGIIPSLICSEILLNSIISNKIDIARYRNEVIKRFRYYDNVYRLVRLLIENRFSKIKHVNIIYSIYRNMKREEKRFGFEINLNKLRRILNSLHNI